MIYDVAVVGAGPAGAWTAYRLARGGARVALFDPSHPREKPCGGGVTGRALLLVSDALGHAPIASCAIRQARFTDRESASAVVSLGRGSEGNQHAREPSNSVLPELIVASRETFDGALLAAARSAGADLLPIRVADIAIASDGVRLETREGTHRARFAIGADGANSLVRRRLARPFRRDELSIATGYYARGVTSSEIVIELVPDPPGYIWSFPRPDHLAVGICVAADAGVQPDALRRRLATWLDATGVAPGARLEPYSWPIPSLGVPDLEALELAGDRWCLVGDAAGLVDPLTREGIYFALASGAHAVDALAEGGTSSGYTSRIRSEIMPELTAAARFKAGFFRPSFTRLLIHALAQSATIREVMADLVSGRQTYAGLKWRLLETLELGLAARALFTWRRTRRAL